VKLTDVKFTFRPIGNDSPAFSENPSREVTSLTCAFLPFVVCVPNVTKWPELSLLQLFAQQLVIVTSRQSIYRTPPEVSPVSLQLRKVVAWIREMVSGVTQTDLTALMAAPDSPEQSKKKQSETVKLSLKKSVVV
jgi:hypothetical protein